MRVLSIVLFLVALAAPRLEAHAASIRRASELVLASNPTSCCPPNAPHTHEYVSVEEVTEARDRWANAVRSLEVDNVVACYAPEGDVIDVDLGTKQGGWLLGTIDEKSDTPRRSAGRIRAYFEKFLQRAAIEPHFPPTVTKSDLVQLGPGRVAYAGYYDFVFTDKLEGKKCVKKTKAAAKFVYIFQRPDHSLGNGPLEIVMHNSGLTPSGVETWEEDC